MSSINSISVRVKTKDNIATNCQHYDGVSEDLVFEAGVATKTLKITTRYFDVERTSNLSFFIDITDCPIIGGLGEQIHSEVIIYYIEPTPIFSKPLEYTSSKNFLISTYQIGTLKEANYLFQLQILSKQPSFLFLMTSNKSINFLKRNNSHLVRSFLLFNNF